MQTTRRGAVGRPRSFDADAALEAALQVFWRHGYEGASLADLTAAMGITRTSMYAAFGNKEQLFRRALERYTEGPGGYGAQALAEPTARGVVETILRGAVRTTTGPDHPAGCLGVQGALATSDDGGAIRELLAQWRDAMVHQLRERFDRAAVEGDLPADADAAGLARYVMTLAHGIAVQAAGGVDRDALDVVVDQALHVWHPEPYGIGPE